MKKREARLIINPREGQNIAKLFYILAVMNAAGYETRIALKEYGGHAQELARQAAEEGDDLVIAYGGDGTLNHVVNGVLNAKGKSIVGVIPGGTANLWATEIGLPTDDPVKAVLALLDSEVRRVDVGRGTVAGVTLPVPPGEDEARERSGGDDAPARKRAITRSYFLLMAGLGLDAVVMQGVSKPLKHKIKQLAVGLSAVKELPAYRPFPLEIRDAEQNVLWQGEAIQVVVSNTRLYADILQMTPEAYIDDGQLDICVITGGDFAGTIQQIFSLLLRRRPDNVTAEYFKGARIFLRVPASTVLQFDGSAIDLADSLSKAQKKALKAAATPEEAMVEYLFEAVPHALRVTVPRTYDNELFTKKGSGGEAVPSEESESAIEAIPPSEGADSAKVSPEFLAKLREEGRKVSVIGASREIQSGAYIIGGSYIQTGTGAAKPAAVRVDDSTTVLNEDGERLPPSAVQKLDEGREIIVLGTKNKRGVIRAEYLAL